MQSLDDGVSSRAAASRRALQGRRPNGSVKRLSRLALYGLIIGMLLGVRCKRL